MSHVSPCPHLSKDPPVVFQFVQISFVFFWKVDKSDSFTLYILVGDMFCFFRASSYTLQKFVTQGLLRAMARAAEVASGFLR